MVESLIKQKESLSCTCILTETRLRCKSMNTEHKCHFSSYMNEAVDFTGDAILATKKILFKLTVVKLKFQT